MNSHNGNSADDLEVKLKRLEAIIRTVENPGSGLGETLRLGEEGVGLCEEIEEELSRCDARVQALLERIRPADA
jgi:exodeoxyribonuclease VII small subunit